MVDGQLITLRISAALVAVNVVLEMDSIPLSVVHEYICRALNIVGEPIGDIN
jgi:hypothetical protein